MVCNQAENFDAGNEVAKVSPSLNEFAAKL
jgi:hypothetical protein